MALFLRRRTKAACSQRTNIRRTRLRSTLAAFTAAWVRIIGAFCLLQRLQQLAVSFRLLVRKARKIAMEYELAYGEEIPVIQLVSKIAIVMQEYTQSGCVDTHSCFSGNSNLTCLQRCSTVRRLAAYRRLGSYKTATVAVPIRSIGALKIVFALSTTLAFACLLLGRIFCVESDGARQKRSERKNVSREAFYRQHRARRRHTYGAFNAARVVRCCDDGGEC